MLVVFSPIFVADTNIIFRYNFVAPLTFLKREFENSAEKDLFFCHAHLKVTVI